MKAFYLIIALAFSLSFSYAQDSLALQQYLQQHKHEVALNAAHPFSFPDSFYHKQLFLTGEIHGYQKAHDLDLALFQHLHQKAGVRHYIAEVDAAQAWHFNQYLQTGKMQHLDTVFNYWVKTGAQWGNTDYYHKLQQLYTWNRSLPRKQQITIWGIDKIQQLPLNIAYFDRLLADKQWQQLPLVDSVYNSLHADSIVKATCSTQLQALETQLLTHAAPYQTALQNNFTDFTRLVNNLLVYFTNGSREQQFVNNYTAYYQQLQHAPMYGFLGFYHTIQDQVNDRYAFAGRLKNSALPVKDQMVSLNLLYMDSDIMIDATMNAMPFPPGVLPQDKLPTIPNQSGTHQYLKTDVLSQDGMLMKIKGCDMLKAITRPHSITIFDMQQAGPAMQQFPGFMDTQMPLPPGAWLKLNNPAGMHYQYLVLIRHSAWAAPFLNK
ncbi:hypothetical protein HNQ91_000341 [Filimonas zeae]|uniref:Erythromycin esterase n=1 Tax=Filimonas zeae TaxID=1737353 RepID=A0A917MR11_9BACT|nr:hypothetical protein [Filimonas zeae]MDR6337319.1 hypothetical protein [Filimonas zeae]GGH58026.1 hypothetical protein GCM10011379_03350 [Filimonas zeae]